MILLGMLVLLMYQGSAVGWWDNSQQERSPCAAFWRLRAGSSESSPSTSSVYGRISSDEYQLTTEEIEAFHRDGCITIPDLLTDDEVSPLTHVFDQFVNGNIHVPGKDFCDMSQPFGIPYSDWRLVNCMLPRVYHPPLQNNVYERLTQSIARQLFPSQTMTLDYDQWLNKRPNQEEAVFAWHQDMAYWPSSTVLNVTTTDTCTFSLALDDSDAENGCLRYLVGTGHDGLRPHRPAHSDSRSEGHALTTDVDPTKDTVRLAPARRGSVTIHNEYVVHGSAGNTSPRQRRTYVIAYRADEIVQAERRIGFTHSHNDEVNWDTFTSSTTGDSCASDTKDGNK